MINFKSYSNPILLLNDSPDGLGGLARIGRDLASLLCTMPEFRVGYLGRGSVGRLQFPWMQYSFPESGQWGEEHLAAVWHDFSRKEDGVIMTLWDASRVTWFGGPSDGLPIPMQNFLGSHRTFRKWGYFPVDSKGPLHHGYGCEMTSALRGYDRLIAASEWGSGVLHESGRRDANWIPHGIFMNKFRPNERFEDQGPYEGKRVLGCNMANQARKDWAVAFECAHYLRMRLGNRFHLWCHTDKPIHYWNLYALAADYGLSDVIDITVNLTDDQLAYRYSICEATILPSAGEGFGYPIAESMACGTPCVVTDYAAGQELVESDCRVQPISHRVDTQYNVRRATLDGARFAWTANQQMDRKHNAPQATARDMTERVSHLDWNKLSTVWKRWFREGLWSDDHA